MPRHFHLWTSTSITHITPYVLTVAPFGFVYLSLLLIWLICMRGVWAPAWPLARTQFVLLVATVPIWAACMGTWMLTSGCIRSWLCNKTGPQYVELAREEEEDQFPSVKSHHRRPWRFLQASIFFALAVFGFLLYSYEAPKDVRYRPLIKKANRYPRPSGYGNGERIFIGAMFHENAAILPFWTEQIIKVVNYVGTDNVYISILESYSHDSTPDDLLKFDTKLAKMGVARRIIVRDTTVPRPPTMDTAEPRIRFLADSRNRVLEPLVEKGDFDRVIFSNDVLVAAESIVELLNTRNGDWDMVCGLDFSRWGLYDAWVIRDRLGRLVSSLWPYFLDEVGQEAVMADEPAPVFTCWNGIVALRADPLLPPALRKSGRLSTEPFNEKLPTTHPAYPRPANQTPATTPPLRFRVSAPKECFSSESFLLPYDLRRQFDMQNIYVNPLVITSYTWNYYYWFKYVTQHWLVRWWMKTREKGRDLKGSRMVIGQAQNIWTWDGGECQPWY